MHVNPVGIPTAVTLEKATAVRWRLFGLMLLVQGLDQFLDVAVHHGVELVERQVDPMVGDPALREIIRADALRPIP